MGALASGRVDLDAAEAEAAAMVVEIKVAQQEWQRSVGTGSRMVTERLCRLVAAYWPCSCAAADASRPRC